MHKFTIIVGDWSDDGHGRTVDVDFECSHSIDECRAAYRKSCDLTGVTFHRDYTNKYSEQACTDYLISSISKSFLDVLRSHGIDVDAVVEQSPEDDFISDDGELYPSPTLFAMLIMESIGLSLTDFSYKLVTHKKEYLNGFWNKDLNEQFGYGLFE